MPEQAKKAYTKALMVIGSLSGVIINAFIRKHDWVNAALFTVILMAGGVAAYRHYKSRAEGVDPPLKVGTLLWKFLKTSIVVLVGVTIIRVIYVIGFKEPDQPDVTVSGVPNIGDTVLIFSPDGNGIVGGAVSSEAFKAMQKASLAKDNEGVQELVGAGQVFIINPGTLARYIDVEFLGPRIVRLLDGPYVGQKAWVSETRMTKYRHPPQ